MTHSVISQRPLLSGILMYQEFWLPLHPRGNIQGRQVASNIYTMIINVRTEVAFKSFTITFITLSKLTDDAPRSAGGKRPTKDGQRFPRVRRTEQREIVQKNSAGSGWKPCSMLRSWPEGTAAPLLYGTHRGHRHCEASGPSLNLLSTSSRESRRVRWWGQGWWTHALRCIFLWCTAGLTLVTDSVTGENTWFTKIKLQTV